jgi:beta-1,4-mannosyl-glycoprotein beta-1,4-N-acetylglucosaminyltransferase
MYNGEEDILDIRLNTLDPVVDKFIFIESPTSHSKLPRELEYPKQKDRFKKFASKINYYTIDYCKNDNFLLNDWSGREVIENILINRFNLTTEDIVIHGDLDEIPRLEILKNIIESNSTFEKPYTLMIDSRQLCLDLELVEERHGRIRGNFPGSIILKGEHLKNNKLYWLRQIRANPIVNDKDYKDTFNLLDNAGWHFSYCAGLDRTIDKFKFFCHAEEMHNCIKDKEGLINCIKNRHSFNPERTKMIQVNLDDKNIPEYVFNNSHLFKEILSFNY